MQIDESESGFAGVIKTLTAARWPRSRAVSMEEAAVGFLHRDDEATERL